MPNVNPQVPGDDIFEQFDLTRTQPIKSGTSITKGHLYTKDTNGYIIATPGAAAVANVTAGYYQAKASSAAVSGETDGARRVQFLCVGSFMLFYAHDANLVEGNRVEVECDSGTVDPDAVDKMGSTITNGFIGRVYQIYTVDSSEERKLKTAANDVVIVQTGVY